MNIAFVKKFLTFNHTILYMVWSVTKSSWIHKLHTVACCVGTAITKNLEI